MPEFQRYGMVINRTRAFLAFKRHHTEVNDLYWSFVPVHGYSTYMARNAGEDNATADLFKATGADVHRLAPRISEWRGHFDELSNWLRLSFIVAALGYLEVYIKSVSELALRSDPCLLYGKSKAVDGVSWLKLGIQPDVSKELIPLVKDPWPSRVAAYRRLFGFVPATLESAVGRLDALRIVRNGASHTFGRSIDYRFIGHGAEPERICTISERSLKRSLSLIEEVAIAIDEHLGHAHIGEFEAITYYHAWRDMPRPGKTLSGREEDVFRKSLGAETGFAYGSDFCAGLIECYRNA